MTLPSARNKECNKWMQEVLYWWDFWLFFDVQVKSWDLAKTKTTFSINCADFWKYVHVCLLHRGVEVWGIMTTKWKKKKKKEIYDYMPLTV